MSQDQPASKSVGKLVEQDASKPLRIAVLGTGKMGGILEEGGLRVTLIKAVKRATQRARELAGN